MTYKKTYQRNEYYADHRPAETLQVFIVRFASGSPLSPSQHRLHQVMEDLRKAFAAQREATSQEAVGVEVG